MAASVPTFEKFLYPFLLFLKDGELTITEMRAKIAKYFHLTEEDLQARTKSGNVTQVNDRIGWARQYFRRALFIDIPRYGTYRITQRGLDYLQTHSDLTIDDLMQYPEYAAYNSTHKVKSSTADYKSVTEQELTPTEQINMVHSTIVNALADKLLDTILSKDATFFEKLVVDLIKAMGYGGKDDYVKVTQLSNDEGIDGIVYEDKLGFDKIYLQAKRWKNGNSVGRPELQKFYGALAGKKASKGVFITTSTFAKSAIEYVDALAPQSIVLIDGRDLARYMIKYNVGVSTKEIYEVKEIDLDYFEE